jgi:hypothetical protein
MEGFEHLRGLLGNRQPTKRPYAFIAEAWQAWERDQYPDAEQSFLHGIGAYRSHEPNGVHFALGR